MFFIPDNREPDILPEDIPLSVLYMKTSICLWWISQREWWCTRVRAHYSSTLVNALLHHCRGNLSGINGVLRPGIVHRIDKDTTGALLVCKTDLAHRDLAQQFKRPQHHTAVPGDRTRKPDRR